MTHNISNINVPKIVDGPEQITVLEAFKAHLLKKGTDSKYLHVSPTLRKAGRAEWLRLEAVEEAAAKCVFDYLENKEVDYGALIALILMGAEIDE